MPSYFCIFTDTLQREANEEEYFQSITLQHPVNLVAVKIISGGAPVPGQSGYASHTEPNNFKFEMFALDGKSEESERLIPVGNGSYHSEQADQDFHLKNILTSQLLIRGNYKSLTLSVYASSSKFVTKKEGKEEKSLHRPREDRPGSSENDDSRFDDWCYVRHVRDVHHDKIYPITTDSDLPLSDSDEEQEPRMALPLAAPTLPDAIQEKFKGVTNETIEMNPEIKAEMEKAPPVNDRPPPTELPLAPPKHLLPVHLLTERGEDSSEDAHKSNEPSLARLVAIIKELKPNSETVRKVSLLEESCESVPGWLSGVDQSLADKFIHEVSFTLRGFYSNMELPPAATVRLLKAGLRLVVLIGTVKESFARKLLAKGVLQRLIYLLNLKDFASPLQLMALNAVDQLISWPFGMKAFTHFSPLAELPGSGYEHVVRLILRKPTVRVAYAAGQILAKVDVARSANDLKNLVLELMKQSAFADKNLDQDISKPKMRDGVDQVDSDNENEDAKMEDEEANPEFFHCAFDQVIPYDSTVFTKETCEKIIELLGELQKIVEQPSSITLMSIKDLPNRMSKKSSNKGRVFISRLLEDVGIVKICLGILHFPYITRHMPVYAALARFIDVLTSSKEGMLIFAADNKASNLLVQSLLASNDVNLPEQILTSTIEPIFLAMVLSTRLQTIGFLDELVHPDTSKWSNKYWSPLQALSAIFSKSDYLSEQAANLCADHCRLILNVMKSNGPSSIQAAELLHTVVEHSKGVTWLEVHMVEITATMEADNQISDVLSKLFTGQVQFTVKNSLINIRRLSEALEFGISLEIVHGPAMSFYIRVLESLLTNEMAIMTAMSNSAVDILTASLVAISKCVNFNSIANQPLPLRSHVQTKQIVMSTLRCVDRVLLMITKAGFSYPDKKLCSNIIETFAKIWTVMNYGDDLLEDHCELTCTVLEKYLRNPEKATDLLSSSWYVLVSSLTDALLQQPSYAVPVLTLFQRLMPCSTEDPYLKVWEVIFDQDAASTESLLEYAIALTHSGHVQLANLASNVLIRLSVIKADILPDLSTKIQHKFAPLSVHENGETKLKIIPNEKAIEIWTWRRSAELLSQIIKPKSFTEEETNALIDSSLTTLTKAAIDCHSDLDHSPTSAIVGLFFTLSDTGHLTNTEYISILTTGCDLIAQKRPMSMGMMACLMELIILAVRRGNMEVKKLLREKVQRSQLKQFLSSFFGHVARIGPEIETKEFFILYNFIRIIISSLEKTDLTPIFQGPDSPFKGFMKSWAKIKGHWDEEKQDKFSEVDQFFATLSNPFLFEIESPPIREEKEAAEIITNTIDFTADIVFEPMISQRLVAENHLLCIYDLVEVSRDIGNIKLEEEIEKLLLEPEITCITEEDQKQETFTTRIGRSMTLQRRNESETTRRGGRAPRPAGQRRSGRPSALHVDEYNKAGDESDSDNDRGRHYSGGDGFHDRSQSPRFRDRDRSQERFRDRSPPRSHDRGRDENRGRRGGYDQGRRGPPPPDRGPPRAYGGGGYRGSPGGRGGQRGGFSRGGGGRGGGRGRF